MIEEENTRRLTVSIDAKIIADCVNDLRHLRGHALGSDAWAPVIAAEDLLLDLGRMVESRGEVKELPDAAGYWWVWDVMRPCPAWVIVTVEPCEDEGRQQTVWVFYVQGEETAYTPEAGKWVRCLPPNA